jgi:pimeloyl-ACP methyl ester carboxylesterase
VAAAEGPAYAVVAHSLGATATAVALCDGLAADRVVFLAPMASATAYAHDLTVVLGAGERTYRRLLRRIERRAGVSLRHFEVAELGRAVAMPPTLVIHDRDDPSTDVSDGEAIAAAWSESRSASDVNPPGGEGGRPPTRQGARLLVTTGLGHRRILRDPDVIREVVDFVGG